MDAGRVTDELIDRLLADGRAAGVAVVATDADGIVLQRYGGFADLAARRPVDASTAFQIASVSKVATAVLALRQWEAGRLDLHAPVRRYLPWLPEHPYASRTAHQLLSHTAGLPSGSDIAPSSPFMALAALEPPAAEPGRFAYSDASFQVMGLVLEAITGRRYAELARADILEPLGMTASFPTISNDNRAAMAVAYHGSHDDRPFAAGGGLVPAPFFEYAAGDGSLVCTGPDLAAFARMLATGGAPVLGREAFGLLTTPVAAVDEHEDICYGAFTSRAHGYPDLNHGGTMVGHQTMLCADPATGLAVVVLLNGVADPVPLARAVLDALRRTAFGEPLIPPGPPTAPVFTEYAGEYGGRLVDVVAGRLQLDGEPLHPITEDAFAVAGSPYAVHFERGGNGTVTGLTHGPEVWPPDDREHHHPAEWDAYVGHYRAYKVFEPTFRVFIRRGELVLAGPSGRQVPLVPTAEPAAFRIGDRLETLAFDTPAGPHMLRAIRSGCPYYRVLS